MKSLIKGSRQPKQAAFHVKKGDEIVIIAGTQRGQRGKILEVLRHKNRVLIEGVNLIKKTSRPTQDNPQGGIVEREGSIHISNVMLAATYDARREAREGSTAGTSPAKASASSTPAKK